MIELAFRLVWAFACLLLRLSWLAGVLIGYVIIAITRHAAARRTSRPTRE